MKLEKNNFQETIKNLTDKNKTLLNERLEFDNNLKGKDQMIEY